MCVSLLFWQVTTSWRGAQNSSRRKTNARKEYEKWNSICKGKKRNNDDDIDSVWMISKNNGYTDTTSNDNEHLEIIMVIMKMINIVMIIYCWYTRRSTDLHLSTSRSCLCLINPDAIYDQKLRAFWMSLGLDSNLEIALSPLVHRDYGMRFHNTWRILHRVRPSRSVSKNTFLGSPIEALLTMTQTMTMCSAFEHFMNGKGAI